MVIAAAASLVLGHSNCQLCYADGFCCSTSNGITSSWFKSPIDSCKAYGSSSIRCRNPYFGSAQFHWSSVEHDHFLWKVSVAADYSDFVPDSSSYARHESYHPLEEVKVNKRIQDTKLTSAEIARTTVEANSNALLVFPGTVHWEPHGQISWAEVQYVIDDYGDIFFEIFDDKNMLQDPGASNPVNALIGMDMPMYENKIVANDYNVFDIGGIDDIPFDDDFFEVMDSEVSDVPVDWGMPDSSNWIHPIYFLKCMTKAIEVAYDKKMDHPSNGVSIVGFLRPAFADEELYLRRLFHSEDSDGDISEWKDVEILSIGSKRYGNNTGSTLYRLEVTRMELFSVYGTQYAIDLQDFQDAEPDILVHSTPAILVMLHLKLFARKKVSTLRYSSDTYKNVSNPHTQRHNKIYSYLPYITSHWLLFESLEGANLIGVDSLGIDVRLCTGVEVRTHRFPFKVRAKCEAAAEKQIEQLLYPRSRRKKFRSHGDGVRDSNSY